jgi:hypothetical protein
MIAGPADAAFDLTAVSAHALTNGDKVPRLVGLTTKGLTRKMKITDADHTNWRVKDVERSLGFYRDVLGLEPFGLEEYERGEHPLVSLRITPEFILHPGRIPPSRPSRPGVTITSPLLLRVRLQMRLPNTSRRRAWRSNAGLRTS